MKVIILPRGKLALETRLGSTVDNVMDREKAPDGCQLQIEAHERKYTGASHRPVGPSGIYNCHGLTFGSRRTAISDPSEILKIIEEDDYVEVRYREVLTGDIAIYFKDGDVEHSGVVVGKTEAGHPRILSKWGKLHEVVHLVEECPYDASDVKYFRIVE